MHLSNIKRIEKKTNPSESNTRFRSSRIMSNNSKSSSRSIRRRNSSNRSNSSLCTSKHQDDTQKNYSLAYLIGKYLGQSGNHTQLHSEMNNAIERKDRQIHTLKIYRDQFKMINDLPRRNSLQRIQLQALKNKVSIEENMRDQQSEIKKVIKEMTKEEEEILQYCSWVLRSFNSQSILDLQEEKQIIKENLQMEADYMLRQLSKTTAKNAYCVKKMQQEIMDLRVKIKDKENLLQELRTKIFSLHIKLNQKVIPRHRTILSNSQNNERQQQYKYIFLGNSRIKGNYVCAPNEHKLKKIIIYKTRKDNLGIIPVYEDERSRLTEQSLKKDSKHLDEIEIQDLKSLKVFYSSKIVGLQYRKKEKSEMPARQYGQCSYNVQHKLVILMNKKVCHVTPHWNSQQMIGIGIQYKEMARSMKKYHRNRLLTQANNPESKVLEQYFN